MSYYFTSPVDPKKPLDQKDPCPPHWQEVDAKDRSKLFWGFAPDWVQRIRDWELRELEGHKALA